METLFLCQRKPVKREGGGYEFTISENEKTIFLFGVGRDYEFTDEEILDFATSFNISGI